MNEPWWNRTTNLLIKSFYQSMISLVSTICLPRFREISGLFRIGSGNKPTPA